MNKIFESIQDELAKSKHECELRKEALNEVRTAIEEGDQERKRLIEQKVALEMRIAEYMEQGLTFDVFKIGFINSLAKALLEATPRS